MTTFKTSPLPALPPKIRLDAGGYTETMLVQYADRVRTLALLEASNACMQRISKSMAESRANGHTAEDAEALACARAIHALINPHELKSAIADEQRDLFAEKLAC